MRLLMLLFISTSSAVHYGSLWCQQGSNVYSPGQCEQDTIECFKFVCKDMNEDPDATGSRSSFVARGCGVSLIRTATGLANESCYQALGMCQQLGGRGECYTCDEKHMCNASRTTSLAFLLIVLLLMKL